MLPVYNRRSAGSWPGSGATIARMTSFAPSFTSIAEHIDLVIPPSDRRRRCVWFFVRDDERGYLAHFAVDAIVEPPTWQECRHIVDVFAEAAAQAGAAVSILVVLTRPGPSSIGPGEAPWFHPAHEVCGRRGVRLSGVYLAGPTEIKEVFLDDVM
jgi:hypothetical protein